MSREKKYTPGPWNSCHNGECQCKAIWCSDYPVAKVESGEWGDEYPIVTAEGKAKMDMIAYGKISEELSIANANLISAAPDLLEALEHQCLACRAEIAKHNALNNLGEAKTECSDCVIGRAIAKAYGESDG